MEIYLAVTPNMTLRVQKYHLANNTNVFTFIIVKLHQMVVKQHVSVNPDIHLNTTGCANKTVILYHVQLITAGITIVMLMDMDVQSQTLELIILLVFVMRLQVL